MERKRKSFITIGIIVVIILVLIVFIIKKVNNSNKTIEPDNTIDPLPDEIVEQREKHTGKIQYVERGNLYRVKGIIQKFYSLCNYLVDGEEDDRDLVKSQIISMLSNEYITTNGINSNNLSEKVAIDNSYIIEIYNIYMCTNYENVYSYFVNGILRNIEDSTDYREFNLAVNVDINNKTFEIVPNDMINNINIKDLKEYDEIEYVIPGDVEDREYNHYSDVSATPEEISRDYLSIIKNLLLYDIDRAYEHLSDEGKIRYSSKNDLVNFVNNNKGKIFSLIYGGNTISTEENKNIFKIYDQYRRYYIVINFNVFSSFTFDIYEM